MALSMIVGTDRSPSDLPLASQMREAPYFVSELGAGEGNRTLVCSLGSCRSTIELRPHVSQ
jgi:hypothetical protein